MHKFLGYFNCIYELQFRFQAKHSTNHALIDITENVKSALDNKIHACEIFVDLQMSFDTVLLIAKYYLINFLTMVSEVLQMIGSHLIYVTELNMFPF